MRPTTRRWLRTLHAHRRAILAFGLPLILYLGTLAPTVYNLDSAEFSTAAHTRGLVRATGYPLYLLIGHLWSLIPVGDVGYRMNLLSAVLGASTILLADRLLRRIGVGGWASFGALGLLACSRYFWAMSLIAEVYTMHTAFLALLLLLLLRWAERPTAGRLAVLAVFTGLSFGNHLATVLVLPGLAWFVMRTQPRALLALRDLTRVGAAFAAGLAVYLYLPLLYLGAPRFNYAGWYDATGHFEAADLTTLSGLWWLVSGQVFAGQMFAYRGLAIVGELGHFGAELWRAFLALGIGPGVVGLVVMWKRHRPLAEATTLIFVANAGFYANYRVLDKDLMFLPCYLIWALSAGLGLQWLLDWVGRADRDPSPRNTIAVASVRAIVVVMVLAATSYVRPLVDLSDDRSARERGEQVLAVLEPDALLLGWWDTVPVVEYLQFVEGQRPDITAINRFLIRSVDMETLLLREASRRPVYVDKVDDDLPRELFAVRTGVVYRVRPQRPHEPDLETGDEPLPQRRTSRRR